MKFVKQAGGGFKFMTNAQFAKNSALPPAAETAHSGQSASDTITVPRKDYEALEQAAIGKAGPLIQQACKGLEAENESLHREIARLKGVTPDASQIGQLRTRVASETDPTKKANLAREIRRLTESAKQ